jgi:hypothetical protein
VELLFGVVNKKSREKIPAIKIQECGRTGTGQPLPIYLQIAKI